ncbi:ankyrin repeat domain-containing protein 13D isoform X4 [Macrosteles quadrilineatus]|uniref:ankyrin repeat domain-containing protein 13D isoform X4 n=1 Tax=Macrosteles quadrilineatus TaxID=74068 RepID=UPI0023E33176|nr:ankyrin repeat domain-containing protein 13D isoform X4 [Macrosteles quadrilineatus]
MAQASAPILLTIEEIKQQYPLHFCVWNNDLEGLKEKLDGQIEQDYLEKKDARGRSPLLLAVTLGHLESSRLLMEHGANINTENKEGWTVIQEAVATGDPELVELVLQRRDYQRLSTRVGGVPDLLLRLKEAPDFYVEMKWEFTSWYDKATMMEVDHETRQVFVEQMSVVSPEELRVIHPSHETIGARLTAPIVTTYIDTDKISFERNKSGMWGWRQDKSEVVSGRPCKVFGASNVELVTKTRVEHLTEQDKARCRGAKTPLQSFLGIAETEERAPTPHEEYTHLGNPCQISPEEYFSPNIDLGGRDIGRPKELTTKIQKFRATLWLCEDYPLSLQEQIMPIVDLMAISSSHFAKLKNFIQMQLPSGFPIKIEIPLFHVLNARITFGNIFAMDEPVSGVQRVEEEGRVSCILDDSCFEPPASYTLMGADMRRQISLEEDDDMLQYAITQSLLESGSEEDQVDIWEALQVQRPSTPGYIPEDEEKALQRAIQASLSSYQDLDPELLAVIQLSQQQREEEERQRQLEQETLDQVLKLSLQEQ